MQTTESGLIVPDDAIEKKQRTMLPATLRRMRQFLAAMKSEDIGVIFGCYTCKQPLSIGAQDRIEEARPGGRIVITCQCSVREVR